MATCSPPHLVIRIPAELPPPWHQFFVSRVVDHYSVGWPLEHAEAKALIDINAEHERREHQIALRIGIEWGSPGLN